MDMDCFNYVQQASSTQELVKDLLSELGGEMVAAYTFHQTDGRGQPGNSWFCGEGMNIALSLGLKPDFMEPEGLFALNLALSLGALEYVRQYARNSLLKWPNDLYIGEKKLGGVLMENRIREGKVEAVYYGIGWNVNQSAFPGDLLNPVSLFQLDGHERDLEQEARFMADSLQNAWYAFRKNYLEHGLDWTFSFYRATYLQNLFAFEYWRNYRLKGEELRARIKDVDRYGRLLLENSKMELLRADIKELQFDLRM